MDRLIEDDGPSLWIDAAHAIASQRKRIVSVTGIVAVGVNGDAVAPRR